MTQKKTQWNHYLTYGVIENRIYKYEQIPNGFDLCHYFNWINKKNSNIIYDIPFDGFNCSSTQIQIKPTTEYNFLYYLAAIGGPNLEIKLHILKNNLNYLHINNNNKQFDIMLNCL